MLPHKGNLNLTEIATFCINKESLLRRLCELISKLHLSTKNTSLVDYVNKIYKSSDIIKALLLFVPFGIRTADQYCKADLYHYFRCGKDVFYRLLNSPKIDWRKLLYSLTNQLIRKLARESEPTSKVPRCLIIDDTVLPKTGMKIEKIGYVYSHTKLRFLLGFKAIVAGLYDGKSFLALDAALVGEKGQGKNRKFGLTLRQLRERFFKKREKTTLEYERAYEYTQKKTHLAQQFVQRVRAHRIAFDYVLVDSWYLTKAMLLVVLKRKGQHLLGMLKINSKTLYTFNGKEYTAQGLVRLLKQRKQVKRSRQYKHRYIEATVTFSGKEVKLFFSKNSHRGKWCAMPTSNTKLDFDTAFQIYAMRWTVEVFFKEAKQHLRMGKCEARDFDAQIAHLTLCMLTYNLLSILKRFESYETLGGIFRGLRTESAQLTLYERICLFIKDFSETLYQYFNIPLEQFWELFSAEYQIFRDMLNLLNPPPLCVQQTCES